MSHHRNQWEGTFLNVCILGIHRVESLSKILGQPWWQISALPSSTLPTVGFFGSRPVLECVNTHLLPPMYRLPAQFDLVAEISRKGGSPKTGTQTISVYTHGLPPRFTPKNVLFRRTDGIPCFRAVFRSWGVLPFDPHWNFTSVLMSGFFPNFF